jgi:hypothetical protein
MTNNTNTIIPTAGCGLVEQVAQNVGGLFRTHDSGLLLSIPYVHKGMIMPDGSIMGKKPEGVQGSTMAATLDVNPAKMVLDDQGVKNAGEAVKAGLRAIIVPHPVGEKKLGRVDEHTGVMAFRLLEPLVYASLARRGLFAQVAYQRAAGISLEQIAHFEDHRTR